MRQASSVGRPPDKDQHMDNRVSPFLAGHITGRRIACAVTAVALLASVAVSPTSAKIQPTPFRTGLFGITPGQGVRVSVFNGGATEKILLPAIRLFTPDGKKLFEAAAQKVIDGTGVFVDYIPDALPKSVLVRGARAQIRAEVEIEALTVAGRLLPPGTIKRLLPAVHLTLEVFDLTSGQTIYTMPFSASAALLVEPRDLIDEE
jgi:hypothetical protein